jgi:hypothetical protein
LAFAAGIIYALRDRSLRKRVLFWSSFPALFLVFLSTWRIVAPHYLLPAVPFLLIAGVPGIRAALSAAPRALYPLLMTALCLPLAGQSVALDTLLLREDTRLTAGRWIRHQVQPGARILRFPNTPEFTAADPYRVRVDWEWRMTGIPASELAQSYDYVITSGDARIPAWEQKLASSFVLLHEWPHIPLAQFHHPRVTLYGKKP